MSFADRKTGRTKKKVRIEQQQFFDRLFEFVKIHVRKYCDMIHNKEQHGVTNIQSNYEEMIVKEAFDSPEINQLVIFYKDVGICDINCTIFGEQILIDIKNVIVDVLQSGIMICEEDYDKFEKMQNLLFRLCISKLNEVYHLTYDVEHNVIISVICNSLGLNR